jgi:hypothetical protein
VVGQLKAATSVHHELKARSSDINNNKASIFKIEALLFNKHLHI